ncbi:hypothetical protein KKD19_04025 [Patescibacteria group bacterium]|nr:hypothetical protein [Patescibacteria group bacterium]MBU4512374.1 hypothetical protein [Patescibacteria group bacterium]
MKNLKFKKVSEVEKNLQKLLNDYKLSNKLTVAKIKSWIFNDDGEGAMDASNRFQKKWIQYFKDIQNIDELNKIMQVFVDAWNYFPHKSLNNKSPQEVFEQELAKQPKNKKDKGPANPDFIVGGQKIPWDEYWAMIKEMEKLQVPFKNWIDHEVLPKYKKYLEQTKLKSKKQEEHYEVANIFFERVLHVGFFNLGQIRKDFIQKEFPHWWPTHVLMSNLSEKQVLLSLKKLFQFLELVYDIDTKKIRLD